MRLVVTGASGFIGRNVLLRAPREWEITAVYHSTTDLADWVKARGLTNVRPVQCNLLSEADVRRLASAAGDKPDAMLYLAANGDPAASSERVRWDLESNTVAFVTTLEQCPAGHVVYVSSGAVYDGLRGDVSPATPVSPRLPYAISKLASEQYLRFFAEHHGSVQSYVNVRFFGAYGPYEAPRKITTRWLRAMSAGQREFVVRGDGRNLIDFMYVDDAVDGFLALVRATGEKRTVDFASGSPLSVNGVVQAMAQELGVAVTVRHEGHVPEYIEFRSADTTMRDRFGVAPSITLAAGLERLRTHLQDGDQGLGSTGQGRG
ncbi:MAG TPA: NAD-dependent epimerase/dehydratase family protein [Vicinamibacterales bacterium]|nr:NAD-dependent epimerase/dehydratase family protein [Vicinamibacterales bacterium]